MRWPNIPTVLRSLLQLRVTAICTVRHATIDAAQLSRGESSWSGMRCKLHFVKASALSRHTHTPWTLTPNRSRHCYKSIFMYISILPLRRTHPCELPRHVHETFLSSNVRSRLSLSITQRCISSSVQQQSHHLRVAGRGSGNQRWSP